MGPLYSVPQWATTGLVSTSDALCIIAGPTASGKTALAIELAQRLNAEIVSADSQQVYRYFDIGTAKPSTQELASVPHHLISVVDPLETFSAARFQTLADAAISDIQRRGKRVLVVGGTGLYLRILLHGVLEMPPVDESLRARNEAECDALGAPALHARLMQVDPVSASNIPPMDRVRILRALEIHALTGKTASELREAHAFAPDRYRYELWVLDPPRDQLYEAINRRTRQLFESGLIDEVKSLLERGYRNAPPMKSVGYAQALDVVEGRMSVEEAIADTAQKTRHYAKRQWTWFRKERGARFISPPYAELR
jgi:tRNA dimethylallyltransferase